MATRMGRILTGLAMGLGLMALLAGFGGQLAGAQTFKNGTVSVSQHEYVGICKELGGTPSRAGSRMVTCDMGGGYSSTCNFKTNTCTDTIPDRTAPTPRAGGGAAATNPLSVLAMQTGGGAATVSAQSAGSLTAVDSHP